MIKVIQVAGLAAAMAFAGLAGAAHAQSLELQIGPDGVRPIMRDNERRGPPPERFGCSEREARAAARDAGLRDPEVVRSTRARLVVEGYSRRGAERITFANERGCPEI